MPKSEKLFLECLTLRLLGTCYQMRKVMFLLVRPTAASKPLSGNIEAVGANFGS
uniref:Uncharacterized protein n=1 Tax=Rhizophora mucronata TaxID=61149 RepID=A0A2P2P6S0_RHIMU